MNQHLHRIIFNARRGQRMVVAETARGHGAAADGESSGPGVLGAATCALSVIAFAVLLACPPAHSQIRADANAPASQRATVLQAANGVPLVNIQTPSAAGVSRNSFSQFDVANNGAILNNSRSNVQTQLGGWVQGNPWLATGPARVILNEVNSNNPSQLGGFVEVAGQRAEVIIANPAGIRVNGGGFINASGVTLTTGTPVMNSGNLESFRVTQGTVRVDGLGLDTTTADATRILARAIEVNAGLWAQHLTAVTGGNEVKALASEADATATPIAGAGPAPSYMLDVAAIGGMYAGHIFLKGTEAGLGVNNRGVLAAQDGSLVLLADGRLVNSGVLQAKGDLSLRASGGLSNIGADAVIRSDASVSALAVGSITNTQGARITAVGGLEVSTEGAVDNTDGKIASNDAVRVTGASIQNTRGIIGSAQSTLSVDSKGGILTNAQGTISAARSTGIDSGALDNDQGLIQAGSTLRIDTHGQTLTNTNSGSAGIVSADTATLVTGGLDNAAGYLGAGGSLAITSSGAVTNTRGGQITSEGGVDLTATLGLDNAQGSVQALGRVGITAPIIDNAAGEIAANGNVQITATSSLNNTGGTLAAGANLSVQDMAATRALSITNTGGTTQAGSTAILRAKSLTGNGTVQAVGDLTIDLQSDFESTTDIASGGNAGLTITGTFTNRAKFNVGGAATIVAADMDNTVSGQISGASTSVTATKTLTNRGLIDGGETRIQADAISNLGTGRIYGDHVAIGARALVNDSETVAGVRSDAVIAARQRLDLGVTTLDNRQGSLIFSAGTDASALNVGGALDVQGHATGTAVTVNNDSATIESLGGLSLTANQVNNRNLAFTTRSETTRTAVSAEYIALGALSGPRYLPSELGNCYMCADDRFDDGMPSYPRYEYVAPSTTRPFSAGYSRVPYQLYDVIGGGPDDSGTLVAHDYALNDPVWGLFNVPVGNQNLLRSVLEGYNNDLMTRAYRDFYHVWITSEQTTQTVVDNPGTPGRIVSGGTLAIAGGGILNDNSKILAGGALNLSGSTLTNTEIQGEKVVTELGTYRGDNVKYSGYRLRVGFFGSGDYVNVKEAVSTQLDTSEARPNVAGAGSGAQVASRVAVTSPSSPGTQVLTIAAGTTQLPTSGLFQPNPNPAASYLIATDPRFADYRQWLSSDYMLSALGLDPATTQKRLGDGFYEQKLIREQVAQLTGRRFIDGYASDEAQYQALMQQGATVASQWGLVPGVALTAAQMAQLTSDIVWLVSTEVTLVDGSKTTALVPQVYVRAKTGDLAPSGALLAGQSVNVNLSGDLINSGTVAGRQVVNLSARNLRNLGAISGQSVSVSASQDLDNTGGRITAESALSATAGRDLNIQSTTRSASAASGRSSASLTQVDRVAGLYVTGSAGTLVASAGRDMNVGGGVLSSAGKLQASAVNDINLGTVGTAQGQSLVANDRNYMRQSSTQEVGSQISSGGSTTLTAGRDLNARAATINATGALDATAGGSIAITEGRATRNLDESRYARTSGFLSSSSTEVRMKESTNSAIGSSLGGSTVTLQSGADTRVRGSSVVGDSATQITAGGNLSIEAATNTAESSRFSETRKSGIFGSGGLGITIGKQQQSTDQTSAQTTAAASTVGAINGDVTLTAGNSYRQTGSDVLAPGGNVTITAQDVQITEARQTQQSTTEQRFKQSGLSVGLNNIVVNAVQSAASTVEAMGKTSDGRMQALGAASLALNAYSTARGLTDAKGNFDPSKATEVSVSLTLGSSKSQSTTSQVADSARGSKVTAAGNVNIAASGSGPASDVLVRGSDVQAGANANLKAEGDIKLEAARNTASLSGSSSSSSAGIGVSVGLGSTTGVGVTLSASKGRGNEAGTDTSYTNTHITAGNTATVQSGADTTLQGAVVKADTVKAEVGGNLNLQSQQDTSDYASKSSSVGGSLTLGPAPGGSLSVGKTTINSTYASVTEQSGIRAGDGGFEVNVGGNTDLKGAVIASNQGAVESGKNSFSTGGTLSTTDIQNRAQYQGEGMSLSASYTAEHKDAKGQTVAAKPGGAAGIGSESAAASSTTSSGISGIAGNTAVRSTDPQSGIAPIFDKDRVKDSIGAQVAITAEFGKQASKAIGEYATEKYNELKNSNPEEAAKWAEGGVYRVGLHTLAAGLGGGVGGAIGAAASQSVIADIGQQIAELDISLEAKKLLVAAAGTAIGALVGGEYGAASGFNATANNYLTAADLRSRQQKLDSCRAANDPACEFKVLMEYEVKSAVNTGKLSRDSIGEKLALEDRRTELQRLLDDPGASAETKAQARKSINELNVAINVIEKSPVLKDAFEVGLIAADILSLGELAVARGLTSAVVQKFVLERTGTEISEDAAARVALNFYRDGGHDLAPAMYASAAKSSTHNPEASEVVLGRFIANSPNSYEQIAKARGATYFEMADWNVTSDIIGSPNMWNINRAFLDQQIAAGKSFVFTADPATAPLRSYTYREMDHLKSNGYSIYLEGGTYVARKR